eukprot:7703881-Lingulodinium_polyedra.AAC.1
MLYRTIRYHTTPYKPYHATTTQYNNHPRQGKAGQGRARQGRRPCQARPGQGKARQGKTTHLQHKYNIVTT